MELGLTRYTHTTIVQERAAPATGREHLVTSRIVDDGLRDQSTLAQRD